jgi:hypothetical protein
MFIVYVRDQSLRNAVISSDKLHPNQLLLVYDFLAFSIYLIVITGI